LQVRCHFEDAAFAFHLVERLFTRAIGYVFTKNDYARVALHFGVQAAIDQIDHRARIAAQLNLVFSVEFPGSRIDVRRINKRGRGFRRRLRAGQSGISRVVYFLIDFVFQLLQAVLIDHAFID
jgi:hypothetical protein